MHTCVITVTYLRGGLSACSVVWLIVRLSFLNFIKLLMQLRRMFLKNVQNTAPTFVTWSRLSFRASCRDCDSNAPLFNREA